MEYLKKTYPEVKKIVHVIEVTAGPLVEYSNSGIKNYWYKPDKTVVFTNMDVFVNLQTIDSLSKIHKKNEKFCVASFNNLLYNEKNLKKILSESQLQVIDTVVDNKVRYGNVMLLYILKYQGAKPGMVSDLKVNDK